jgi:hypothetical protein
MNAVNPYEVFGITIESSLDDVRKAYYQLALVCHPDKGGNAEDMRIVYACYLWLKEQLGHKTNDTYEDVCEMFAAFWRDHPAETFDVKAMDDIYWETLRIDWDTWLKTVDDSRVHWLVKNSVYRRLSCLPSDFGEDADCLNTLIASVIQEVVEREAQVFDGGQIRGGYGEFLDHSQDGREDVPSAPAHDFGRRQVVVYQEPLSKEEVAFTYVPANHMLPASLDDYSLQRSGCDYKNGLSYPSNDAVIPPANREFKTYQQILADLGHDDVFCS